MQGLNTTHVFTESSYPEYTNAFILGRKLNQIVAENQTNIILAYKVHEK
jgi:hypothetical protein